MPRVEFYTARDRFERLLSLGGRALRFWPAAVLVFLVGVGASGAVAVLRPRVYRSETLILYREGIRSTDLGGSDAGGDPARKLGLKLKEMILSRTRLEQVIKDFNLYPAIVDDRGLVDAVDEMRLHIAFRVKDSDTFGLSFDGNDRDLVQKVTARLADELIQENSKSRAEQAEVTREFLDSERQRVEKQLKERETSLARFLAKHPEFAKETATAPPGAPTAGTAIRAAAKAGGPPRPTDPALLALEREAGRLQRQIAELGGPRRPTDEVDPRAQAEHQAAEADLRTAQKDLDAKLAQFTEAHPDVKAAKARVAAAEARLKRGGEPARVKKSGEESYRELVERSRVEAELRRVNEEIASTRSRLTRDAAAASPSGEKGSGASWIVALETEWTRLNREVQETRERYQQLQDKQFKAGIVESAAASALSSQMVIIDPAYRPTRPAKPGRAVIVGVGLAASLALAFALALGLALLDDRVYDQIDVERLEIGPLLAIVPRARAGRVWRRELG